MGMPVQISDGERVAIIDRNTNSLVIVPYPHKEIHGGTSYRLYNQQTIGSGNAHVLCWKTPNGGKQMHAEGIVFTENSANLVFYELLNAPTANGTVVDIRNANRNYPDNSTVQFMFRGSTLNTTNAVNLVEMHIGAAGSNPSKSNVGGASDSRGEWVLKEDTWYAISSTDTSSGAQDMSIALDWYEHTPKTS